MIVESVFGNGSGVIEGDGVEVCVEELDTEAVLLGVLVGEDVCDAEFDAVDEEEGVLEGVGVAVKEAVEAGIPHSA